MKVAILTPTYNRANLLHRLYESLKNQPNKNFVWYIVDDGSKDDTEQVVNNFIKLKDIEIKYFKKENGGKHTALNMGIKNIVEPILVIVDSDDHLALDAVETILNEYSKINNSDDICGLGFLKEDEQGNIVGKKYTRDNIIDTFVNQRYNKNTWGDKAEVFKTEVLKQFPFPEFEGERFLSEATVWVKISGSYKMKFINKAIYICEYQVGGLSDNVQRTLYNNPLGAKQCYKALSGKQFNLKNKIKYTLLYIVHSLVNGEKYKEIIKNCNNKLFGFLLYIPAKIIYRKRKQKFEVVKK